MGIFKFHVSFFKHKNYTEIQYKILFLKLTFTYFYLFLKYKQFLVLRITFGKYGSKNDLAQLIFIKVIF